MPTGLTVCLTANSVGQFLTVLLIFAFVLFITWFTTRFIGNFQKEKSKGQNVKILETVRIAQNKYIQIVQIGDKYFALAVCKDSVTTLGELTPESLSFDENPGEKISFKDFLNKAKEEEKE